uniref:NADH dehydrogenase [ubiquinone] 1 subunit C2 n=1 Tax=Ditylenchus dipsaci TaxID=166011 RepID=A0A915EF61_9BILA
MAECTRYSEKERQRREDHFRMHQRPYTILDPFTWSNEARLAIAAFATCLGGTVYFNAWYKKPWYYGIYMRGASIVAFSAAAYGFGKIKAYNYSTRDAVVEHYAKLHPKDFEQFTDIYGRPHSAVMTPWPPRRAFFWDRTGD